jgi:murein DD-endopeptidase / murein LD-carboxypeptidase
MRSLFLVSVAVGILSGTVTPAEAQTGVNMARFGDRSEPQFIDGIELKRDAVAVATLKTTTKPITVPAAAPAAKKPGKNAFGSTIETCLPVQFKFAQLMDMEVEAISHAELFNFIEDWWAVRYRYGGTTKKGVDCSSYTGKLLAEVYGFTVPRTAREQYRVTQRIGRDDLAEGDLVFFNTRGGVSHVGVYLGNGHFTHSSSHSGVTISSLDEAYYSKRYIGGGRVITEAAPEVLASN